MAGQQLAQVVDPQALDAAQGSRVRMTIDVPPQWLRDGAQLEVTVPKRLLCDHCEGGGCDACGRSGALRVPVPSEAQPLRISLPANAPENVQLRLVDPFQTRDAGIEQLILRVQARPGGASKGVRLVVGTPTPRALDWRVIVILAVVLLLAYIGLR